MFVRSCIPQTRTRESGRESLSESNCQIWSTRIVNRWRHCAQGDVDDLNYAELDVLLHCARGPISKAAMKWDACSPTTRSAFDTRASGTPAGTNWPTRRSKWT